MEPASLEVVYPVIEDALIGALPLLKPLKDGEIHLEENFMRSRHLIKNTATSSSIVSEDEGIFMSRSSMASSSEGSSPNLRMAFHSHPSTAAIFESKVRNKAWPTAPNNWTMSSFPPKDHPRLSQSVAPPEEREDTETYFQFGAVGQRPIRRLVLVKEADRCDSSKKSNNDHEHFYDISPPRTPRGLIDVDARSPCCERELCILDKIFLGEMTMEEQQRARDLAATPYGPARF